MLKRRKPMMRRGGVARRSGRASARLLPLAQAAAVATLVLAAAGLLMLKFMVRLW